MHGLKLALSCAHLFHYGACAVLGNVDYKALHRLAEDAVDLLHQYLRSGNAQLIALTAHIFDKDRKVHLTSAAYSESVCALGLGDTEGNVTEDFLEQSFTELTGGNELALSSCKGAVVYGEGHLNGRLGNFYERQGLVVICCAECIADGDVLDTGYPYDIAHLCLVNICLAQTLDLAYGNDLAVIRLLCFVVIADDNGLIYLDNASFNTADTCSAHIIVIVDRGDEHLHGAVLVALGCGDIVEDSIEKGLQVCACLILAEGAGACTA